MWNPINGGSLYTVNNRLIWVRQGGEFIVGGLFTTTPGTPSQQLLPSTNTLQGYDVGQMLAYANGDGTGIYSNLTPGGIVNFDPSSTDSGQVLWNLMVIVDPALIAPLDLNTTFPGTLQVATAKQNWTLRQQFLYAGGTPQTDVLAVAAALAPWATFSSEMNPSGNYETIFAY